MEVGRITQLDGGRAVIIPGDTVLPRAIDIRIQPEIYIAQLETRIEQLEALLAGLENDIKDLQDSFKDLSYDLWESINGYDI